MIDEQLFEILFNPADYIHESHFPPRWQPIDSACDPILNYWLFIHHQLEELPQHWAAHNQQTVLLLQNWQKLPTIAHLIGGYLLRISLLKRGLTLYRDPALHAFITLPLMHHVRFITPVSACLDTRAYGLTFILSQCQDLPPALEQRFQLLFPAGITRPTLFAPAVPDNINLLNMAITYANNSNHRTASKHHAAYQIECTSTATPVG